VPIASSRRFAAVPANEIAASLAVLQESLVQLFASSHCASVVHAVHPGIGSIWQALATQLSDVH